MYDEQIVTFNLPSKYYFMRQSLLILVSILGYFTSFSQWNTNPAVNSPICSTATASSRSGLVVTPDGLGGMISAWVDSRTPGVSSVYFQVSNLTGPALLGEGGALAGTSINTISNLSITPDGVGGAIIAWQSNDDIFAQRVTSSGTTVFTNPVPLSVTTTLEQRNPVISIVNTTEAMVVFQDLNSGNADLHVNKINTSTGSLVFVNDIPVCSATGIQDQHAIFPDGAGGLFVSWSDRRAGTNIDVYATHLKNDGTAESGWAVNGTLVCGSDATQGNSRIVLDGTGGIYMVWEDFRAGNSDIYAQRLTATGTASWATANGTLVCNASNNQQGPQLTPTSDGVIITWTDGRISNTANRNIYAQKLALADGSNSWPTANGIPVCEAADNQPSATTNGLKIVPDGANGAIIAWNDRRLGSTNTDIYAQRVSGTGTIMWPTTNGVPICTAAANQGPDMGLIPVTVTNGAYIAWQDSRSGTINGEIFGALIDGSGNLSSAVSNRQPLEGKIKAYPVPASKDIYLSLSKVKPGTYTVQVIDISGRMLLQNKTAVTGTEGLIETKIEQLQSGVYFIKLIHESSKTESVFRFTKQ